MRTLIPASVVTALLSGAAWFGPALIERPATPPAAVAGPGAIAIAVQQLCGAIDKSDGAYMRKALTEFTKADGVALRFGDNGRMQDVEDSKEKLSVVDVGMDGAAVHATNLGGAVQAFTGLPGKSATVQTKLLSMQANCPSGECSWATFQLQRTWTVDGKTTVQPLFGTALARYTGGEPSMQIYAWHISAGGPAVVQNTAPASAGKKGG